MSPILKLVSRDTDLWNGHPISSHRCVEILWRKGDSYTSEKYYFPSYLFTQGKVYLCSKVKEVHHNYAIQPSTDDGDMVRWQTPEPNNETV